MEWTMSTIRQESPPGLGQHQSPSELLAKPNSIRDLGSAKGANFPFPSPRPKRWVSHRKAEVVTAVNNGYLSLEDALDRYELTIDEYMTWRHGLDLFGLAGLRVSEIQRRRRAKKPPAAASSEASETTT
jgi:Protein of unknown function (DUF1153)